jgi:hypothetical protein
MYLVFQVSYRLQAFLCVIFKINLLVRVWYTLERYVLLMVHLGYVMVH